jgi:hypothetical protein
MHKTQQNTKLDISKMQANFILIFLESIKNKSFSKKSKRPFVC